MALAYFFFPLSFEKKLFCHFTIQLTHNSTIISKEKDRCVKAWENSSNTGNIETLSYFNKTDIKLYFLTSHLLNIHKAFSKHVHFKPLQKKTWHTFCTVQKSISVIHQSCNTSLVLFSRWQTTLKKQGSVI